MAPGNPDRRIAWITGASRGIGRATALRLAQAGHDVAIGHHANPEAANEVRRAAEALGARTLTVAGDLGDPDEVTRQHAEIEAHLGPVDVLVANHGIYERGSLDELDKAAWQRTIDVNLTGAFHAARLAAPGMQNARRGRILFMGSIRGRTGSAHGAHYAAAKAALLGVTRSLAHELGPHGITVNLIAPGQIATDILAGDTPDERRAREASVPMRRIGTPEDVAAMVAFLASDDASYVTGAELRVDGGYEMG